MAHTEEAEGPEEPGAVLWSPLREILQRLRSGVGHGRREPRLLHGRQPALETLEVELLFRRARVAFPGQVLLLQRVALQVVHLPLAGLHAVRVEVLRELPPRLADA